MNMLAEATTPKPPRPARSPAVAQATMLQVIRECVAQAQWAGKGEFFAGSAGQAYPAQALMRALIYAILTGLKQTLEAHLGQIEDLNLWRSCDGARPDWATLVEFGQSHQDALKRCLGELFRRTVLMPFGQEDDRFLADSCIALAWDRWFEFLCGSAEVWTPGQPPPTVAEDPRLVLID